MPNYRRWKIEGGVYFFTLVTHGRRPVFAAESARALLRKAFEAAQARRPFKLDAIVLLPDHLHMIWRLPDGDSDFSRRIAAIKYAFTRSYLGTGGMESPPPNGAKRHRNRGVWQKRFYEHCIRDSRDFKRHLDYIHVNPVKHGLVAWPRDWAWSTFHRYFQQGEYERDWCGRFELPGDVYVEPDAW